MKKIKYMLLAAVGMVAGLVASCTDGNDWGTDGSYSAVFKPTSTTYSSDENKITWETYDKADSYVIELIGCYNEQFALDPNSNNRFINGDTIPEGKAMEAINKLAGRENAFYDQVFTVLGWKEVIDPETGELKMEAVKEFDIPDVLKTGMYQYRIKGLSITPGKKPSAWCYYKKDNGSFFEVGGGEEE